MTDIIHISGAPLSVGGGIARLAQGAPPPGQTQTYTVSVVDTLSAGARTNVPFLLGVPLRTGWAGNASPFANTTLTARVGDTPAARIGTATSPSQSSAAFCRRFHQVVRRH
jgi:hypothetical protein